MGDTKAFQKVLALAYGRSGKLKWELLEVSTPSFTLTFPSLILTSILYQPLLTDPTATPPAPVIPKVKDSLPPVYPKPLQALIMNAQSMATRPLRKDAWTKEKLIGPRANPYSQDAHFFGPFPKRREYNVQWRFFRRETKKVLPPLEIASSAREEGSEMGDVKENIPHYAESLPLQDCGLISEIESLVGESAPAPLTRREKMAKGVNDNRTTAASNCHPSRWVRRRYRQLLSEIPILTHVPKRGANNDEEGSYSVRQSSHAPGNAPASNMSVREIDDTNLAWLMHGGMGGSDRKAAQKANRSPRVEERVL